MRPHSLSLVPTLLVCLVLAGGCGGDDSSDDSGGGGSGGGSGGTAYGSKKDDGGGKKDKAAASSGAGQLKLTADPSGALKFDKTSLSTKAGKTAIVLDNPSSVPHAIEVEGKGLEEEGDTVEKGGVSKVTVDLKPGEYEYYCPVDGHRQAGMEGTLKVG